MDEIWDTYHRGCFTTRDGRIIQIRGRLLRRTNGVLQCKYQGFIELYDMETGKQLITNREQIYPWICRVGHFRYIQYGRRRTVIEWDLKTGNTLLNYADFVLCRPDGKPYFETHARGFEIVKGIYLRLYDSGYLHVTRQLRFGEFHSDLIPCLYYYIGRLDGHILTLWYKSSMLRVINLREIDSARVKTLSILPDELQHHILLFLMI